MVSKSKSKLDEVPIDIAPVELNAKILSALSDALGKIIDTSVSESANLIDLSA